MNKTRDIEIKTAQIEKVSLTMQDHGCLTFYLMIAGDGWFSNYGGYCIGHGYLGSDEFVSENGHGLEAMMYIMNVIGVECWEDLKGKYCRIKSGGWGSSITCIGNIIKDQWFDIDDFFENIKGDKQ